LILWEVFWAPCIVYLLILCQVYSWKDFLPFCRFSFQSGDWFLCCAEVFSFMQSDLSIFPLHCWATGVPFIEFLPMPMWSSVFHIFSWIIFTVSDLTLRSLINLNWC
jgi:hypothetical protein